MRSTLACLTALLLLSGCGDDSGTDTPPPPTDGGSGPSVAYTDPYDESCLTPLRCTGDELETTCTCVSPPPSGDFDINLVGCSELDMEGDEPRNPEDDFCDPVQISGRPNVSCMMPGMYREQGPVQMVTLYGVVDVFGNGGDADAITVEVYEEVNGDLGTLIGSNVATIASPCSEEENEIEDDMIVGMRQLGFYQIANVPTETQLVIKTSGNPEFWRELYTFNIQVTNDEVDEGAPPAGACADLPTGARHEYRARTLSRSDYNAIPLTAGLPAGIQSGNGALAGEVHDCDNTRIEFAQVGVDPPGPDSTLAYFNDNPSNPLPVVPRPEGTSKLGLYAALNVPAGVVDVSAIGRLDGELISLGWYRARVFPNAVSVVTFRGLRSQQVPAE